MATPLEILKARRLAIDNMARQNVANQTTPQNRLGANIMNLGVDLLGGFKDPQQQAYDTYQETNKDYNAAQQAQGEGGAFTPAPYKPDYNPQADVSGMSGELRSAVQSKQDLQGLAGLSADDTESMGYRLASVNHPMAGVVLTKARQMKEDATATAKAQAEANAPIKVGKGDTILDPNTYKPLYSGLTGGDSGTLVKNSEISDQGFITVRDNAGNFTQTKVLGSAKVGESGKASAVTKIYGNGTIVQALPNGSTVVKNPDGTEVYGQDRIEALRTANKFEVKQGGLKSGTEAAATESVKQATEHFKQLGAINKSIGNMDEAIEALSGVDGADTGFIASMLPSIRASSIKLDNIQKSMGLDVVGMTTFGALSKGELDLALSKALPLNLNEDDLKVWLQDKKAAQEKLADYVENAAIFLGTPGNNIQGWLQAQKSLKQKTDDNIVEVDF
tara:strand:+ start:7602 stop:8942 length:1341 start_codon:yes stop_codon:yes gene_type:complete